jgi:hypothetical protein
VADIDSERDHAYELLGARDREEKLKDGTAPGGAPVIDGGRTRRVLERFTARLPSGVASRGIVRIEGSTGASVHVLANGQPVGAFDVDDDWSERTFDVPAAVATGATRIELRVSGGAVTTYHYWFVTPG